MQGSKTFVSLNSGRESRGRSSPNEGEHELLLHDVEDVGRVEIRTLLRREQALLTWFGFRVKAMRFAVRRLGKQVYLAHQQ